MRSMIFCLAIAFAAAVPSPSLAKPQPILTEAEIAPCNELLSTRVFSNSRSATNLELALSEPPFSPLYDLETTKMFLPIAAESIAALRSGSPEAQKRVFGIVWTRQDAADRLISDRRFQCLLNVRLRQLTSKAGKQVKRKVRRGR